MCDYKQKFEILLMSLGVTPESVANIREFDEAQLFNLGYYHLSSRTNVEVKLEGTEVVTTSESKRKPKVPDGLVKRESMTVAISEITVPTAYDKRQLLKALEYIHDLPDIDDEYKAVDTLIHMYMVPGAIKVQK